MKSMLSFIGRSFLSQWWLMIFGTVVISFFELALVSTIPIFTSLVLKDDFQPSKFLFLPSLTKESLLVLMLVLTLFRFVLQIAITKTSHKIFSKIYTRKVIELNSGYLRMSYLSFKELDLNTAVRNSTITIGNATFGVERFFDACKSLILIVVLVIALGVYNITSLFVTLIASMLVALLLKINKKPTAVAGQNTHDAQAQMQSLITESYKSFKELKFNNNIKFYLKNAGNSIQHYYKNVSIARMLPKLPMIYMESIVYLAITSGFAYWSISLGRSSTEILPSVVFYLFIIRKLLPSFNEVMHYFLDFKVNLPAIHEVNSETEKIKTFEEVLPNTRPLIFDEITLKDINFGYKPNISVLKNINLTLKKGDRIALIGKSGSGKSTLSEIMASLIDPQSGSFKIDDKYVASLKPFRKEIGYLPQSFYVFSGTLLENILLSDSTPDQQKLERCINASMVSEFLPLLEDGLHTLLREQGNLLSGGQRQRVALARVLYHDSKLLILDEATSSLDKEIEKQVLQNIHQYYPDLSMIFVTHRPDAVAHFDKKLQLERGSLVAI